MLNKYLLLQAQLQCSAIQLLIAETDEYKADWLKNVKTVVRDSSGRFAKAGQELQDTVTHGVKEHNRRMAFEQFGSQLGNLSDKASAATSQFAASAPEYASRIASGIQSTPELFEAAKDFTFGGGYKESIESLITHFHGIESELRKAATKKYKQFEPKLQKMKGKEFEQAIQDELIKLHLLEKRNLVEDIKDIDSADDIEKVFKEHQAEFLATATSVVSAVAWSLDDQTALNLLIAIGLAAMTGGGSFLPVFCELTLSTIAFEGAKEVPKALVDLLTKGTEGEKHKKVFHLAIDIIVSAAFLGYGLNNAIKDFKTASQAQGARNAEASASLEDLLSRLGVDSIPKTKEELKTAHRKMSKKLHPDAGGNQEDFVKMQQAYEELLARLKF